MDITGILSARATGTWRVEAIPYDSGSPATGGLYRFRGTTEGGPDWSVFVKLLQHARHWSRLDLLPAHLRQSFVD